MAITKAKKVEIVDKIADGLKDAASVVFVHFKGLSVADTAVMRKSLREQGIGYFVAKKTLMRRALTDQGYEGTIPELPGEIAIAWGKGDATLAAREIYGHGKKYKDAVLSIVGGIFDGKFVAGFAIILIAALFVIRSVA